MRYLIGSITITLLLASCAWDNSPPPLHSRIRMDRSADTVAEVAPAGFTNSNRNADFDTNKLQGAGGGSLAQPSGINSRGTATTTATTGPSVNPPAGLGGGNAGLGGTSTGGTGLGNSSPTLNSQPPTSSTQPSRPAIGSPATNPTPGPGANTVP